MNKYHCYRILLNQESVRQTSMFSYNGLKEVRFSEIMNKLSIEKSVTIYEKNKEYTLIYYKSLQDNFHIIQLGKKTSLKKTILRKDKFENINESDYPFIHLLFDVKRQLVFIEVGKKPFVSLSPALKLIQNYLTNEMNMDNLFVNLNLVSDNAEFWDAIQEFELITEVNLEFYPPNLWGGMFEIDELNKQAHTATNFERFILQFKNKVKGLVFKIQDFGEEISRIASGGGTFKIKGKNKNGGNTTLNSNSKPYVLSIGDVEELNINELDEKFEQVNKLNNLNNEE